MDTKYIKTINEEELQQVEKYGYIVVGDSAQRAKEIEFLLAENAELQRRLDAIVEELEPEQDLSILAEFIYEQGSEDFSDPIWPECGEWQQDTFRGFAQNSKKFLHARVKAIAEGKQP